MGLGGLILAIRFGPAATLAASLALPAVERPLTLLFPAAVREEIVIPAGPRKVVADLYQPRTPRAALLLVHGLSRDGRRHPELVRLARLLARHRQLVLVPQIEGLVAFRLGGTEVDDIRAGLQYLSRLNGAVGIAGFSFGAGPALLAAADFPALRLAGSFGGYADLTNLITFVTTGVHTFGDRRYVQPQEPYNRWKLLMMLVSVVQGAHDRATLGAIAERKLRDPAGDCAALEAMLTHEGRTLLRIVANTREDAVATLVAALSPQAREAMASLSPLAIVPRLRGRLLIAHGLADDSIPFTESLRLAAAAGGRAELVLLETFHHTGTVPWWWSLRARTEDAVSLLRLADALLHVDGRDQAAPAHALGRQ